MFSDPEQNLAHDALTRMPDWFTIQDRNGIV